MRIVLTILSFLLMAFAACNSAQKTEAVEQETIAENELHLSPDQLKVLALQFGELRMEKMNTEITVQGKIDLPPQNLISVNFPLGGYLRSTKLIPGMHVSKGEIIALMEDQQVVQLQQDYLSAKARLSLARAEFDRQQVLQQSNAGNLRSFQQAEAELKLQAVMLKSLEEKLKLIGIVAEQLNEDGISGQVPLRSTINGYVSKVNVNTGKYVQPTETIFELIDPDDIHVALTIFEKDLPYIKQGNSVLVRFVDDKKLYQAEVILVNRGVDDDRTAIAHCHFRERPQNLLPGMFVEAQVAINGREVAVLPDEAVVFFNNRHFVFLKKGDALFEMQAVKTGLNKDGKTEITSGLEGVAPGSIVMNNAYQLLGILKNSEEVE